MPVENISLFVEKPCPRGGQLSLQWGYKYRKIKAWGNNLKLSTSFPQTIHSPTSFESGDPEIFLSFHRLYYYYDFFKFIPDVATRQAQKGAS
jgi:hypothetical protein